MGNVIAFLLIFMGLLVFGGLCYRRGQKTGFQKHLHTVFDNLPDDDKVAFMKMLIRSAGNMAGKIKEMERKSK